ELVLQIEQRAVCVACRLLRRRLAEDVVEHLEGEGSAVSGEQRVEGDSGDVEATLAGEAAVVATPLEHVHGHSRSVGELQEEEQIPGDLQDPGRVGAARED